MTSDEDDSFGRPSAGWARSASFWALSPSFAWRWRSTRPARCRPARDTGLHGLRFRPGVHGLPQRRGSSPSPSVGHSRFHGCGGGPSSDLRRRSGRTRKDAAGTAIRPGLNENAGMWSAFGSRVFITMLHAVYWPIVAGLVYIDLQSRFPPTRRRAGEAEVLDLPGRDPRGLRRRGDLLPPRLPCVSRPIVMTEGPVVNRIGDQHRPRAFHLVAGGVRARGTLCPSLGRLALLQDRPDHRSGRWEP